MSGEEGDNSTAFSQKPNQPNKQKQKQTNKQKKTVALNPSQGVR